MEDRSYRGPDSVGEEYDAWTADGVLERHWGEHIHHGWYPEGTWSGVDFRDAKRALVDRLLESAAPLGPVRSVLDVGCGIGGSSRILAQRFEAEVLGVTLSSGQVERARALTPSHLGARFEVADALHLPVADQSQDLVWSCESGEHMPDKPAFFREMARVLAPGGTLILATWCHREGPLVAREARRLQAIYRAWALPFFVPLSDYTALAKQAGLDIVVAEDWSAQTAPTWRHQIALGLRDLPWLLGRGPRIVGRSLRDAWAVKDMILGFDKGTIVYGVMIARRRP